MRHLLSVAILFAYGLSWAQDSIRNVQLEEVYVIGVRAAENDPVTKLNINKAQIERIDYGQDASLHLQKLSPSIVTYSDAGTNFGNYMSFRLRGMDQDRINVSLNGVPLNDMLDQGVYFSNFADFSNSIESVQIQRGVGTSANGISSYAGSINYESISLYEENPGAGLRFSGGSFGSMGVSAEAMTGKTEKGFSAYARASRLRSQGFKDYSGSDAHSFFFSGGYLGEKHVLKITGFMGKTQNHQSYDYVLRDSIDSNPETNNNNPNDVDDFEQEMLQLQYTYFLNPDLSWNTIAYYSGARGFFPYTFLGDQYNYGLENNQYGIISNMHFNTGGYIFDAGIHAYLFDRKNYTSISPAYEFPYYDDKSEKNELSVFAKGRKKIGGSNLTLMADIQVRHVNMIFQSDTLGVYTGSRSTNRAYTFVNPKIGASYQLNESQRIYFSYGSTGREPTRVDIFGGADGVYGFNYQSIISTDSTKAEYVSDFELGYEIDKENFNMKVNGFYMLFNNEISEVGGVVQNTYFDIRENVEYSQRYGLELVANYSPLLNLNLGLLASYLQTNVDEFNNGVEIRKNVEHAFSPDFIIQPSVMFSIEKLKLSANMRYISEAYTDLFNSEEYKIPASLILNASINYDFTENISAGIWINNITDELYFTDGAPLDVDFDGVLDGPGYRVQAPRNYLARLNIRF